MTDKNINETVFFGLGFAFFGCYTPILGTPWHDMKVCFLFEGRDGIKTEKLIKLKKFKK